MPNRNGPKMSTSSKSNTFYLRFWQVSLLLIVLVAWHWASQDRNFAFFFGQPVEVAKVIWVWFVTNADIYQHLGVTLTETVLAFIIGTLGDRKSVVSGKSVSVRVDLGGRRIIKKKK